MGVSHMCMLTLCQGVWCPRGNLYLPFHGGDISLGPPVHCSWEVSLCEVHRCSFASVWIPRSVSFVHH